MWSMAHTVWVGIQGMYIKNSIMIVTDHVYARLGQHTYLETDVRGEVISQVVCSEERVYRLEEGTILHLTSHLIQYHF